MTTDNEFRIRPGRIRSPSAQRARPFIAQALAAAQRAGGRISHGAIKSAGRSRFGRGQRATIEANRLITSRSRGAVVKARFVRHGAQSAPLAAHLNYLRREGVARDGEKAKLFGPGSDDDDPKAFAKRCRDDRHHFRFIVSPDDAAQMSDLKEFAGELVSQMERDLGTRLDWVGAAHWNTGHPHLHLIVRGVRDDGENLVVARDYIKQGLRDRASDLITRELGPRTDQEIHRTLETEIGAERWTNLDRQLARDSRRHGVIDLAPHVDHQPDEFLPQKVGRLRKLEALGLAHQIGHGQWTISDDAEAGLRELGQRGDIIKRIHRGLADFKLERSTAAYVLAAETSPDLVVGPLIARGLDDELRETAYAVVDGIDGRTHHIRFPDLEATADGAPGSIVELRRFEDASGRQRVALAVRSDLPLEHQVTASGATWLDRQAIAREPLPLGGGFGADVQRALERRAEHLIAEGLAERQARGVRFSPNLIETLRRRELDALAARLTTETNRPALRPKAGEHVAGVYRQRFTLASGRFAMIDNGLGFQLVPWSPSLDKHLGQHVSGLIRSDGGIDWSFARKRGLGL
ncbi:MAG: DUF3363 domain-containing protein [Devosia sp.]|nr:DUF3363 domain-containing protein [Devosia sp.]